MTNIHDLKAFLGERKTKSENERKRLSKALWDDKTIEPNTYEPGYVHGYETAIIDVMAFIEGKFV